MRINKSYRLAKKVLLFAVTAIFHPMKGYPVAKIREIFACGIWNPGTRFSKVPVTFQARNQIFKSKYKEKERRSWLANYSILFH